MSCVCAGNIRQIWVALHLQRVVHAALGSILLCAGVPVLPLALNAKRASTHLPTGPPHVLYANSPPTIAPPLQKAAPMKVSVPAPLGTLVSCALSVMLESTKIQREVLRASFARPVRMVRIQAHPHASSAPALPVLYKEVFL